MEWSEFAERFSRELAGLDRDTILIVRERDESRHYVQAMREPDRLYAEAVSNNFLDGPLLLTPADEEVLSEAGWRPPTADWSPANWWTELPPPATTADFARLADMMVTALRDVQGVRRPTDLVYESFHRHGNGLIELIDFGIEPADRGRISERRTAGHGTAALRPVGGVHALGAPLAAPNGAGPNGAGTNGVGPNGAAAPPTGGGAGSDGAHQLRRLRRALPGPESPAAAAPPAPSPVPGPGPVPGPVPGPGPVQGAEPHEHTELEERLADAKRRGDHLACFELLLETELALPVTGRLPAAAGTDDLDPAQFVTTALGGGTVAIVFTSPQAMNRSPLRSAGTYRRTTFGRIADAWPDPQWSLAVDPGLPSELLLDSATIARLDDMRRTAERAATVDAVVSTVVDGPIADARAAQMPVTPPQPAGPALPGAGGTVADPGADPGADPIAGPATTTGATTTGATTGTAAAVRERPKAGTAAEPSAGTVMRPPHGARLWWQGDGAAATPVAVYDAAGSRWEPVSVGKRARRRH